MPDDQYGPIFDKGKIRLWCEWCGTRRHSNDNGRCVICGGKLDSTPYPRTDK